MTDAEKRKIAARVKRGAKLLDNVHPGWAEKIVVDKFEIWNTCQCVLGQVFGYYGNGCQKLFGDSPAANVNQEAVDHGFLADNTPYAALEPPWIAEIERRLEAKGVRPC